MHESFFLFFSLASKNSNKHAFYGLMINIFHTNSSAIEIISILRYFPKTPAPVGDSHVDYVLNDLQTDCSRIDLDMFVLALAVPFILFRVWSKMQSKLWIFAPNDNVTQSLCFVRALHCVNVMCGAIFFPHLSMITVKNPTLLSTSENVRFTNCNVKRSRIHVLVFRLDTCFINRIRILRIFFL